MMALLWNSFWLVALLVPTIWALTGILDTYFIKSIYRDEYDGIIAFGVFSLIPCLIISIFIENISISIYMFAIGITGGALRSLAAWFYFRAIIKTGDMSLIQLIWNLSVIIVPLSTFLFLGERLQIAQYVGIGIVFIATSILSIGGTKENLKKIAVEMTLSTIFFSGSLILGDLVYKEADFLSGFAMFSLGSFLIGIVFFIGRSFQKKTSHLFKIFGKNFGKLFVAEAISMLGGFISQRAIFLSEENLSVSYVAVADCLTPAFVVLESWLIYFVLKTFSYDGNIMEKIYREQIDGMLVKTIAIVLMISGVFLF